jgi:hypothetical protein
MASKVKVRRRREFAIQLDGGGELALIGPRQPDEEYGIYLRIGDRDDRFVGVVEGAALVALARRLRDYVLPVETAR